MKHPQLRRARKVGEAVFRGANSVHTFEVFPLTTDIRDSAAVFIISRRITDRSKTGHHRAVCVGEADSIVSEIKRHKRAKCVKIHEANAICVLRENDRSARSQVIDDLVAARSFDCVRNVSKSVSKPAIRSAKPNTSPNLSRKPEIKVLGKPVSKGKVKTSEPKVASNAKASDSGSTKRLVEVKRRPGVKKAAKGRSEVSKSPATAESVGIKRPAANATKRASRKVKVKTAGNPRNNAKRAA